MATTSLKKNAFYSVLKAFMNIAFPVITFPYASRILGPEAMGKVNFSNSVVSYFLMIAGLGVGEYAVREAAKRHDDKEALSKFVKEILFINGLSTLISYLVFICTILLVPKLFPYRSLLIICSLKILFTTLGLDWLYTALEKFRYVTMRSFCFQILSLIFLFAFVRSDSSVIAYAIFGIISAVGSNIFNFIHSRKYISYSLKTDLHPSDHLRSIIVFTGMSFVTSVYTMLDTTMVGILSTDSQVGYYSAATKLNHMIVSLLNALTGVLLPRLSQYLKKKENMKFTELSQKSFSIIMLLSIPLATGLFLFAKPLVLLFSGDKYIPAVITMQIIIPIIFFIPLANITGTQILPALNKEKISLCSYITGASLNIICNLLLIPKYGASGAAIGTVIAESTVTLIQIIHLRKAVFTKEILFNLFQAVFATSVMAVILYFYISLTSSIYVQLFGGTLIGILIYALILRIIKNKYFIETVNSMLLKRN